MNPAPPSDKRVVYRLDLSEPLVIAPTLQNAPAFIAGPAQVVSSFPAWMRNLGVGEAVKTALKVLTRKRIFFGMEINGRIVQSGWAHLGFCRHYLVEPDAVVLGVLWTVPDHRGKGLASQAMRQVIATLSQRNYRRFYVDTTVGNKASLRMIQKAGFTEQIS